MGRSLRECARPRRLEICVVDLDAGGAEVGDVEEFFAVDFTGGHAFVDRAVRGALVGVVDFQDRVCHIHHGIPAGDGAILGRKDENRLFAWRHWKVSGAAVEDNARWRRLGAGRKARRWNHDKIVERTVNPVAVGIRMRICREGVWGDSGAGVERGGSGVIVADPPRAAGGASQPPGVSQVGVDDGGLTGNVGDEICFRVVLCWREVGKSEDCQRKGG